MLLGGYSLQQKTQKVQPFGTNRKKEKMFNKDDFDNLDDINEDTVPDGVVDASDYALILKQTTEYLKDTDYESAESRMVAMMNIVNLMHENEDTLSDDSVYGVVIALMYHIQTVLSGMVNEDREEYFNHLETEVLPIFSMEASMLPYYDNPEETGDESSD